MEKTTIIRWFMAGIFLHFNDRTLSNTKKPGSSFVCAVLIWAAMLISPGLHAQPGSLDTGFNPGPSTSSLVNAVALQPDGKILIGGFFTNYNGTGRNNVARLNADGTLDPGFDPGTGANGSVYSIALQPDGKILIGGRFTSYNDTGRNRIARLNADGSLDTGFDPGTGFVDDVLAVALQPDGKILIGGRFPSYNGTWRNHIVRLNADGSLDTGFDPGSGANDWVYSIALQPNGKILMGGFFTSYNGTGRNRIARLNTDGSLDTGFDPGTGASDDVLAIALQPDGKILMGGYFTSYNGTGRNRIARLNATGSLDTGFDPGTGANDDVLAIALQPDGKILIGGRFTSYNGAGRNHIARLNANGALDTGFQPGTGTNDWVYSIALQPDGKILIGGIFTNYNGTGRNRIARVHGGCGSVSITFTATPTNACSNNGQIVISGETGGTTPYMYSIDNGANYQSEATFTGLAGNTYQVKIKDSNGCESAATTVIVTTPTCPATGSITWTGAADTNWDNPCNWNVNCVPTANNDVFIPNVANAPSISTAALANSVRVNTGAVLTIAATGSLAIDGSTHFAGYNTALGNGGRVVNNGTVTIGANAGVGSYGIYNIATFQNNTGGQIRVERSSSSGIFNSSGTFTNAASITIGANAGVGRYGIQNLASFNNNTGGQISVDRSTEAGIYNLFGTFNNAADITIGANAGVGSYGLDNKGPFNNNSCAQLTLFAPLSNTSTFTNIGLFTVNTTGHTNTGTLTNDGIIAYPQDNPIANVTNNEIIIAPTTANDCDVISPAFGLGNPVDFTIVGIFTNQAATMSAGTYVTATNTFTPTTILAEGTYTFYVKIMDGNGGCTRIIPWQLTTEDCCDAPQSICKTATIALVGNSASLSVAQVNNGSTADCGLQSITVSPNTFNCTHVGTPQIVTLTIMDVKGASASCQTTVTVQDNTPPTVVCKNTTVFLNAAGNYTLLAADVFNAVASSDNCSDELTVTNISPATVSCNQLGMTIPVTVTVQDAAGNSATCTAQITVQEGTTLPQSWSSNDVGNANGSSAYKPCTSVGQFSISATGFSTSSADVLHLTARQLCGNGEIIARVASVSGGGWAGITLRESLAPGSKLVALKTQSANNIRRMIRTTTNSAVSNLNFTQPQHTWLRLVRNGSSFTGYTSANGATWSFAFSATVSMTGCIYAGLFAESINNAVTTTGIFDNVQFIGGVVPLIQAPQTPAAASNLSPEVYPNPTNGEVNIDLSGYADPVGSVRVFDVFGKLVKEVRLDRSSLFRMELDGADGFYFLSIEVEGEAPVTKRVVVAH